VRRVARYAVEQARVGQKTDFDKLTLDIETDGSIDSQAALREAAELLISQLAIFTDARPHPGAEGRSGRTAPTGHGLAVPRVAPPAATAGRGDTAVPDRGSWSSAVRSYNSPEAGREYRPWAISSRVRGRAQRDPELRPRSRSMEGHPKRFTRAGLRPARPTERTTLPLSPCATRRPATKPQRDSAHRKSRCS